MSKITSVNLNELPATEEAMPDPTQTHVTPPSPVEAVDPEIAADIDTDELEGLLLDLKKTKNSNKAPPKKRVRKPKVVVEQQPEPAVVEPVAVEPVAVEAVVKPSKPKRKYIKKPTTIPEVVEAPIIPAVIQEEEPAHKTPANIIEEMQRAERALRYQMRKNKMQTLVTQAF